MLITKPKSSISFTLALTTSPSCKVLMKSKTSFLARSVLDNVIPFFVFSLIKKSKVLPTISFPFAPESESGKKALTFLPLHYIHP